MKMPSMKSGWVKWLASVFFGIACGHMGYGIVAPFISPILGAGPEWLTDTPGSYGLVVGLAVFIQLTVAIAITLLLARIDSNKRLIGWGCIILGTILLLNVLMTILFSGLTLQDLMNTDTRAKSDTVTAFWFWMLVMALPILGSWLILYVVGFALLWTSQRKA
ncbi:hypothetical protein [Roseibium aggregatum]|uniref:hypothetical protein n=1 Tax=Roseibium aggregatum TaxID=187304 RepID=UPI001E49D81D|nr:hypothetical protein [Roseibium aggregatum]